MAVCPLQARRESNRQVAECIVAAAQGWPSSLQAHGEQSLLSAQGSEGAVDHIQSTPGDDRASITTAQGRSGQGRFGRSVAAGKALSRRYATGVVYGAGTATGSILITLIAWWITNR